MIVLHKVVKGQIKTKRNNVYNSYGSIKKTDLLVKSLKQNWDLYLILLPVIAYYIIFHYMPMYGIQIAFKDYSPAKGIWNSQWIGMKHFLQFFKVFNFWGIISNTIGISLYQLVAGFPAPIILALMINEVRNKYFKKTVQMVTYAPHFLSVVVLVGMVVSFLSPSSGVINKIIKFIGGEEIYFMSEPAYFKTIYVFSGIWKNAGWGTIIYIATLSGINPQLYEAAVIDGANKFKRLIYITLPCLIPTVTILLIMDMGRLMQIGFEKVLLMQNSLNISSSEVISTYVYKKGLLGAQFSFSSAVGLFNSLINFTLLVTVNKISKKLSGNSLW